MKAAVIIEMGTILVPCAAGIIEVCRSILAANGKIDAIDLGTLADTLSVWALIAVITFCAARLIMSATHGDRVSAKANQGKLSPHDQRMSKVLAVLVGFAGLLVCEPIGDIAERWFYSMAHGFAQSVAMKSYVGYVGFAIQFIVASVALALVVEIWDIIGSRFLGLKQLSSILFRR